MEQSWGTLGILPLLNMGTFNNPEEQRESGHCCIWEHSTILKNKGNLAIVVYGNIQQSWGTVGIWPLLYMGTYNNPGEQWESGHCCLWEHTTILGNSGNLAIVVYGNIQQSWGTVGIWSLLYIGTFNNPGEQWESGHCCIWEHSTILGNSGNLAIVVYGNIQQSWGTVGIWPLLYMGTYNNPGEQWESGRCCISEHSTILGNSGNLVVVVYGNMRHSRGTTGIWPLLYMGTCNNPSNLCVPMYSRKGISLCIHTLKG